jgi:hypothetical protein
MDLTEFAGILDASQHAKRSMVAFLSDSAYDPSLMATRPLPVGFAAICEKSAGMVAHADFILEAEIGAQTEVDYGVLKGTVADMLSPIAGVDARAAFGPPGLGKTTIAYAMSRVLSEKTDGRVAVFHVNSAVDGNANLLVRRVSASTTTETVTHMANYGAIHPITADFLNQPHDSDPNIKRGQSIGNLPDQQFDQLVKLMHRHDQWPVPAKREDWEKELLGVPQITPIGAAILPQWGLDESGKPVQSNNFGVVLILDEFGQAEDQKAMSLIVGAMSPDTARTGNPFGTGFPSGWVNQQVASGKYNPHRFLFAAGNDPEISGGDSTPMDALASRLAASTFAMPRSMQNQTLTKIMASNMLGRVTHKDDPFQAATISDLAKRPNEFVSRSPLLDSSVAAYKGLLTSIVEFEALARTTMIAPTAAGMTPSYLEAPSEYNLKYAERGWGNVVSMRNLVNLSRNLAGLRLDKDKATNARVVEHEIVKSIMGAGAASHIKDPKDDTISKLVSQNLPVGNSLSKAAETLCESIETSRKIKKAKAQQQVAATAVPPKARTLQSVFKKTLPKAESARFVAQMEASLPPDVFATLQEGANNVDEINAVTLPSGATALRIHPRNPEGAAALVPHMTPASEVADGDAKKLSAWLIYHELSDQCLLPNSIAPLHIFNFPVLQKDATGNLAYEQVAISSASLRMMLTTKAQSTQMPPPLADLEKVMASSDRPFETSVAKKTTLTAATPDLLVLPAPQAQPTV